MKRHNNLYGQVYDMDNLRAADANAMRGKRKQSGVRMHVQQQEADLLALQEMLINKTYKTSPYTIFTIREPKERVIYRLPFFPDRPLHHAVMQVIGPVLTPTFTEDTYACIQGRGIHAAAKKIRKAANIIPDGYYLKLDIKKYYPSVDHDVLKGILRMKIKDSDMLQLLDGIIDSAPGLPIGNYLSQLFATLYLSPFDHWVKEEKGAWRYFRYADDMLILSDSKVYLNKLIKEIRTYIWEYLHLIVKDNWRIAPIRTGIDMLGYVFFPGYVRLRPGIRRRFARAVKRGANRSTIAAYKGWAKHANCKHLIKKLLPDERL